MDKKQIQNFEQLHNSDVVQLQFSHLQKYQGSF